MKHPRLLLAPYLFLILSAFSCNKDDDYEVLEATATLHWSGDYAVDGCGFSISLNENRYKPDNEQDISATFKKEEPMSVRIKYSLPGGSISSHCGFVTHNLENIRLLSIKEI